jgi:16S rRNA (cytidine1402-2'-O)-methyltransferase
LVATPIGNYDDITLRALETLKSVDFIICEEYKEARRLLAHYKIEKELFSLNEHNEKEDAPEVITRLSAGKTAALISDCGTPLFSDPGHYLVDLCIAKNIEVVPIPGASSLMPALVGSGLNFEKFYYYGWLSPKKDLRAEELTKLKTMKSVLVVLDTPYRLRQLLSDVNKIFGPKQHIVVAFNLTMDGEQFFRGEVSSILKLVEERKLKGEFVLLIDNAKS